jgi:hypothetical protein
VRYGETWYEAVGYGVSRFWHTWVLCRVLNWHRVKWDGGRMHCIYCGWKHPRRIR